MAKAAKKQEKPVVKSWIIMKYYFDPLTKQLELTAKLKTKPVTKGRAHELAKEDDPHLTNFCYEIL